MRWGGLAVALALLCGVWDGAAAQSGNPSFALTNGGRQPIIELYATPSGVDRWGRDRLAANYLTPGQSFPVRLPGDGSCVYDIRVVYADGRPEEKRRLNTCGVDSVVFPGGRTVGDTGAREVPGREGRTQASNDPSFRLLNRGRSAVNELYVSGTGDENWGEDRLGDETVAAGATRVIRMRAGDCRYDVRVVFANGEAVEKRRVDLCAITDLRVP